MLRQTSRGGSAVRALRETLVAAILRANGRVNDLWDPQEPATAMPGGVRHMSTLEQDRRRSSNLMLIRTGTAIGGASVFFE